MRALSALLIFKFRLSILEGSKDLGISMAINRTNGMSYAALVIFQSVHTLHLAETPRTYNEELQLVIDALSRVNNLLGSNGLRYLFKPNIPIIRI